jgi:hypothetical protein
MCERRKEGFFVFVKAFSFAIPMYGFWLGLEFFSNAMTTLG